MNNIIKLTIIAGFMQHFVLASEARIDYVAEVNRLFAPLEQRAAQHAMERNNQNDLIQSLTNQLALLQKELADTKVTHALKERDFDVMKATLTDKLSTMTQDRDHWKAAHDARIAREEYFILLLRKSITIAIRGKSINHALFEEVINVAKEGRLTERELENYWLQLTGNRAF